MHAIHLQLQQLATCTGAGDHGAFRRLYTILAPPALATVCVCLPEPAHQMPVVRATFHEVWWMCAFDLRCGTTRTDIGTWITGIAQRRSHERRQALYLIGETSIPATHSAFWTGLMTDHDQWTQFELATMLDGHDTITAPKVSLPTGNSHAHATADRT